MGLSYSHCKCVLHFQITGCAIVTESHARFRLHICILYTLTTSREPEWQAKSTNPIHPFALIQADSSKHAQIRPGKQHDSSLDAPMRNVYRWLSDTFRWRPVFDWDWFVSGNPDDNRKNLDMAYEHLSAEHATQTNPSLKPAHTNTSVIVKVATQFGHIRAGGIPLQLLIGRRNPDASSLYWGWPRDDSAWNQFLEEPFDANLKRIAPLIDTLLIFYDLRNPLDEERLEEIDKQQCYHGPLASCPRIICPWKEGKHCPFDPKLQWHRTTPPKTANKHIFGKAHLRLASNHQSHPPVGELADIPKCIDGNKNTSSPEPTLHQIARRAAYEREAVGWQRFWSEYAPKLTNLSELQIRMPDDFDHAGSVRLSQLLSRKRGWSTTAYADEQQHLQTREDILEFPFSKQGGYKHRPLAKIWPGGSFVRRTWVGELLWIVWF